MGRLIYRIYLSMVILSVIANLLALILVPKLPLVLILLVAATDTLSIYIGPWKR